MALTYQESSDLMQDIQFRGRIKVAALALATYYLGEAPDTPSHNSRYKWGQGTYQNPEMLSQQLHPAVVMDDRVQAQGTDISDLDLKSAVEAVVNKII